VAGSEGAKRRLKPLRRCGAAECGSWAAAARPGTATVSSAPSAGSRMWTSPWAASSAPPAPASCEWIRGGGGNWVWFGGSESAGARGDPGGQRGSPGIGCGGGRSPAAEVCRGGKGKSAGGQKTGVESRCRGRVGAVEGHEERIGETPWGRRRRIAGGERESVEGLGWGGGGT
jgi:hypothetical protein